MPDTMVLDFKEALCVVEQHVPNASPRASEIVELLDANGRVLAEPVIADRDIPPFPRSTRDGYAVRSADLAALPAKLRVIGEIKAGPHSMQSRVLQRGETFSIMTGAPVPPGADAVVMVEYTSVENQFVEITRGVAAHENIVAQGAEAKRESILLEPGSVVDESAIALAASVGKSELKVFVRPRVAILTTGDEIVGIDAEPGPTQIRNSNSYSLAAQVRSAGGEPLILPIAPDEPRRLRRLIEQGLESDLLIMTGGVSMGRYDLVEQVLSDLKAEFFFTGANIQPGKPVVFGRCPLGSHVPDRAAATLQHQTAYTYFFGLPGNPVSTMVTFELFARPMVEALAGSSFSPLTFLHARLKSEIRVKPGLTRFLPARLSGCLDDSRVELVSWQGSGDIAARARSNCYIVIPPDREQIAPGEWVAIMLPS